MRKKQRRHAVHRELGWNLYSVVLGLAELQFIFPQQNGKMNCSAGLCIGSWKGAENTPELWLLLGRAGSTPAQLPQHSSHQDPGGAQSGQQTQIIQRDIPFHRTSAQILKLKRGGRGDIHFYNICLPEQLLHVLKLCFPGSTWTSLTDGK